MTRQFLVPSSRDEWLKARVPNLNSTEISALLGLNPRLTKYELWHRKREKDCVVTEPSEQMRWGSRLEEPIAKGIAEEEGIKNVTPMPEYIWLPDERVGSSFDFAIGRVGILETKLVSFGVDGWELGEELEAPLHYEIQVQHQLWVSEREYALIGALIGGYRHVVLRRERDEKTIERLKKEASLFWESVDSDDEPAPDFQRDAEFLKKLYSDVAPGKIKEPDPQFTELCEQYLQLSSEAKKLEEQKKSVKSQILIGMGDAEKYRTDSCSVSAGVIKESQVSYTRKAYRRVEVRKRGKSNNAVSGTKQEPEKP